MKDFKHIFLHSLKSYIDIDIENYLLKLQIQKWKREKLLVWEYHYIVCMKNQTFPQISYVVIEFIFKLIRSYVFYPDYGKDKFHSQYMECLVQKLIHFNHYFNLKCKKITKWQHKHHFFMSKIMSMILFDIIWHHKHHFLTTLTP